MAALTREQILGSRPRRYEDVEVPEWAGTVRVVALTAGERLALAPLIESDQDISVPLTIACARDEAGAPLFTDADREALLAGDSVPLQRVALAAARVNKMRKGDLEPDPKKS